MKYRVRHLTSYTYGEPVLLSHHVAHLRPRLTANQDVRKAALSISPRPAVLRDAQEDYFGNLVTYFTLQEPHTRLEVDSQFTVAMDEPPPLPDDGGGPWEAARAALSAAADPRLFQAMDFLFDSPQVPWLDAAGDYATASFPTGRPLAEAALDLTRRIFTDFTYDPKATTIGTPLSELFAERKGVCQDFAHVLVACCRSMGLAARYVSGYLRTLPPPGKPRLVGADASHAWASVFIPGWGWLDVDPTNNTRATIDHVSVSWGRDFDDVSPIKGVVLGGGEHMIKVSVDVEPLDP